MKSLLSGSPSLECKVERLASPEGCAITTMRSGTLVRSPKGLFLSEGHGNGPLSVKFDQATEFLNQSGRPYCGDTSDDSEVGKTFVISPSQSPAQLIIKFQDVKSYVFNPCPLRLRFPFISPRDPLSLNHLRPAKTNRKMPYAHIQFFLPSRFAIPRRNKCKQKFISLPKFHNWVYSAI